MNFVNHCYSVESLAVARNVEDLAATKMVPMIPDKAAQLSRDTLRSKSSSSQESDWVRWVTYLKPYHLTIYSINFFVYPGDLIYCMLLFQSRSSERIYSDLPSNIIPKMRRLSAQLKKRFCTAFKTFGIKACANIESQNAALIRNSPLYTLIGKHSVTVDLSQGKWNYTINIWLKYNYKLDTNSNV